jgi:uncharacterized protein involved in exopolysaccharide biosynthesis
MSLSEQSISSNGHSESDGPGPRIHLLDYLIVLARYWRLIVGIVVGGTVLVLAYTFVMPQTYSASGVLFPPEKSQGINMSTLLQGNGAGFDLKALSQNSSSEVFARILNSRSMGDSLVRRLDLLHRFEMDSSERQIAIDLVISNLNVTTDKQGMIEVEYEAKTGFFSGDSAQKEAATFAAAIVNNAIDVLDKLNQQKMVTRARRSREFLGVQKERKRHELDSIQHALQEFQQKNKAVALDKQLDAAISSMVEIESQIQKLELEIGRAEVDLNPDSRIVQGMRQELATLKENRKQLEDGQAGSEALGIAFRDVPELSRQYANLKLALELNTQLYSYMEAQYSQEQVEEARELPTVTVLDSGTPPLRRSAPRRTLIGILSLVLLFCGSVLGVLVFDTLRSGWKREATTGRARILLDTLGVRPKQTTTEEHR